MKRVMMSIVAAAICGGAFAGEPVKYRGLFINDEDWGLRPWANRHFHEDGIGVSAYKKIFALMKSDGLNLMWPAMHPGGYEFVSRPENMALAAECGIRIGTSHCEPMLRNNIYIAKEDKKKYNWEKSPEWVRQHWQWSVDRYATNDVLWTVGMRGIHDGPMSGGTTQAEKIALLEDVLKAQFAMLPKDAPKLFIPYKEVLSLYNAGLKVPNEDGNTTIMWVNDNYGYIRRLGGPQTEDFGGGIYYHVSYHGWPHSYCHICTTPPALAWYELVQKCANNNVRGVWMINAGDVFQAEILLYSIGKFAEDPDYWMTRPDPQSEVLGMWVKDKLGVGSEQLAVRILAHLNEYYNLGFIRKPEHMKIGWTENLPETVRTSLLERYEAFLADDIAIEKELGDKADEYFRTAGYATHFLANGGMARLSCPAATVIYCESDFVSTGFWRFCCGFAKGVID